MTIYFYRRQCNYPDCEKFFPIGTRDHYCDEHFLVRSIEHKIIRGLKIKKINKEIDKMKKEKYDEIYEKAFKKIMKEEGLNEM